MIFTCNFNRYNKLFEKRKFVLTAFTFTYEWPKLRCYYYYFYILRVTMGKFCLFAYPLLATSVIIYIIILFNNSSNNKLICFFFQSYQIWRPTSILYIDFIISPLFAIYGGCMFSKLGVRLIGLQYINVYYKQKKHFFHERLPRWILYTVNMFRQVFNY